MRRLCAEPGREIYQTSSRLGLAYSPQGVWGFHPTALPAPRFTLIGRGAPSAVGRPQDETRMSATIAMLGGVGLFLLGMAVMTDGLKGLAGTALRRVLG